MKILVNNKDLTEAVTWTGRAVPDKPNHPILGNILIQSDDQDKLQLTGFDLSMGINALIPAQLHDKEEKETVRVTVPSKLLLSIVQRLPDGEIELEIDEEYNLSIISSSGKFQIRGLNAEEYPALPGFPKEKIEIPAEILLSGGKCFKFASSDETKQVLTGIHIKIRPDKTEFASTNGHCLMVVTTPSESEEIETDAEEVEGTETKEKGFQITIPARAFREVERMVERYKSEENSVVNLYYEKEQAVFELAGQRVTCRALDRAFPAYPQLIPSVFGNIVTVDRRNLLGALERVAVVALQKNGVVVCRIDNLNQQISLSADVAYVGNASESLPAQISAEEPQEIAFSVKYLIGGVKEMDTTEISLQLNQATSPVLVVPVGGIKMTFLMMPVSLRN